MSHARLPYEDQDPAGRMTADCTACAAELARHRRRVDVSAALEAAPPVTYDSYGSVEVDRSRAKRIEVSDAAAFFAARLHLHLD